MKGGGFWSLLFRLALRLHGRDWRARYGAEAEEAFREGLEARARPGNRGKATSYALRALGDAAVAGWRERRGQRERDAHRTFPAGPRRNPPASGALAADLRLAFRRLRKAPGFGLSLVVILALGVGVNAAVFTVLRRTVMAPLPFPQAERLVLPRWASLPPPGADTVFGNWSYPRFVDFRAEAGGVFQALTGYAARSASVSEPGDAESVGYELVAPGYFELLGQVPVVGRFFLPEDEEGAPEAPWAVLSHALWVQRFGSDPHAVGRTLVADGVPLTVVGVAPEGFRGLTGSARFWTPLGHARAAFGPWAMEGRNSNWFHVLGRLRPGLTPGAAGEALASLAMEIEAVDPIQRAEGWRVGMVITPLSEIWTGARARVSIGLVMAAALLVLAIAVANLGGLLLARSRRETRDTAVRLALGASRGRLARSRLTEMLLLAGMGAGVGLLLAVGCLRAFTAVVPMELFAGGGGDLLLVDRSVLELDTPAALLGAGVALLAGVLFGILPSVAFHPKELSPALAQGGGTGSRVVRGGRGRGLLVAGQVALSVVLLVGAGLLLGTLWRLQDEQRGFEPENLLVLRYSLGGAQERYADPEAVRAFHASFRQRLEALPGVVSASLGTTPPLGGHFIQTRVSEVVGREPYPPAAGPLIGVHLVDERFFATVGAEELAGRGFTAGEFTHAEQVAVLSRRAVEELFGGEDPIGREIRAGISFDDQERPFRVVGVVEDILYSDPTEGMMPEMYLPLGLWPPVSLALFARTAGDPGALVPRAREVLASLDREIPFWQVTTGMELRAQDVSDARLLMGLLGIFAALALVLSGTGLWAVVAQVGAERRREIGLRMALGADAGQVERLVLRQGMGPVVGGGIAGLVLAAAGAPGLSGLLFGVGPRSPAAYMGAATILVAVGLLATWLPARRAVRVSPGEILAAD